MKVHTPAELCHMQADMTFRMPPWVALVSSTVWLIVCIASGLTLVYGRGTLSVGGTLLDERDHPYICASFTGILWAVWALLVLIVMIFVRDTFLPTLKTATNWVLKVKGNRLYLNLRNYRNTHVPDDAPVIVSFERREIESVGQQVKRVSGPSEDGETIRWKERRLEIRLKEQMPQELIAALEAQPEWSAARSMFRGWLQYRTSNYSSLVSYDDRVIHIMWSSPHDGIWPRIDRALAILGRSGFVSEPEA